MTAFCGELGCHSEDTKVLTPNGIKDWREIRIGDLVLGVDRCFRIVPTRVKQIFVYDYTGPMIEIKSLRYNFLVTPNHRMIFKKWWRPKFEFIEAGELVKKRVSGHLPVSFWSDGVRVDKFDVGKYITPVERGKHLERVFEIKDFLMLMGLYLSEGSIHKCKGSRYGYPRIDSYLYRDEICRLLDRMGLKYSIYKKRRIMIWNLNLGRYFLERCGTGCENKRIPPEIFELHPSLLLNLFEGMMFGDGSYNQEYYTVSKQLAFDFIKLCLMLGFSPSLKIRDRRGQRGGIIDGRPIITRRIIYEVGVSLNPRGYFSGCPDKSWFGHKNVRIVHYNGKVWCFETDVGNFFTMRGGRIGLSGNSGKTLAAVHISLRHFFLKGRKVYSNINLYGVPFFKIDSLEDLNKVREGVLLGDELWQYCVQRGSYVVEEDGNIRKIEDFFENGNSVLTCSSNPLKLASGFVGGISEGMPVGKCVRIRTNHYSLTCTPNHKIFVFEDGEIKEREAKDLKVGDWCVTIDKINYDGKELISKELAELLGYIFADGWLAYRKDKGKYFIMLYDESRECLEYYAKILQKFGQKCYWKNKNKNLWILSVYSKDFVGWLYEMIKDSMKKTKSGQHFTGIPEVIVKSNNEILAGFLRGVFDGDGCCRIGEYKCGRGGKVLDIRIVLICGRGDRRRELLEKIKYLLLRFGIKCHITYTERYSEIRISDRVSVLRYAKYIGFNHPKKRKILNEAVKKIMERKVRMNFSETIPFGKVLEKIVRHICAKKGWSLSKMEHYLYDKYKEGYIRKNFNLNITRSRLERLIDIFERDFEDEVKDSPDFIFVKNFLSSGLGVEKIKSIEYVDSDLVYDIWIPGYNNFFCNGILVHNCMARYSRNISNKIVNLILLRSRKREFHILYTAQNFSQIDKYIRNITDFLVVPVIFGDYMTAKLLWYRTPAKPVFYKEMHIPTLRAMMSYNTFEEAPDFTLRDEKPEPEFFFFLPEENPALPRMIRFFEEKVKLDVRPLVLQLLKDVRRDLAIVIKHYDYGFTEEQKNLILSKLEAPLPRSIDSQGNFVYK